MFSSRYKALTLNEQPLQIPFLTNHHEEQVKVYHVQVKVSFHAYHVHTPTSKYWFMRVLNVVIWRSSAIETTDNINVVILFYITE